MKCSKSLRSLGLCPRPCWEAYDAPPDPLVMRGFLPLPHSHVLVGIPASRSQFFPSRPPNSIPGSAPICDLCGAEELWILVWSMSPPHLCLWALCPHHEQNQTFFSNICPPKVIYRFTPLLRLILCL